MVERGAVAVPAVLELQSGRRGPTLAGASYHGISVRKHSLLGLHDDSAHSICIILLTPRVCMHPRLLLSGVVAYLHEYLVRPPALYPFSRVRRYFAHL